MIDPALAAAILAMALTATIIQTIHPI